MQTFTGWQYLLIDVANHAGLDKEEYEPRIQWAQAHLDELEQYVDTADEPELYAKAVLAIRRAQKGEPTGHMVGFDSVCSGMQIMSILTGCIKGARATGLIDHDRRADAYTDCTDIMRKYLPHLPDSERAKVKNAVMTSLYGSKREPKNEFGDGTDELNAFYKAMYELAPGPCELLDELLNSWQPYALSHEWKLPDGFCARVKVIEKVEKRIEVDELDHATFTYQYRENAGCEYDRKNAANVVHSVDAYVLRSLIRRCNYDRELMEWASNEIQQILFERHMGLREGHETQSMGDEMFQYLLDRYERSEVADVRILDYVHDNELRVLSSAHLRALACTVNSMLEHKPFPIICVHDEFKCHPNHMNHLRKHYNEIMVDLAKGRVLDDILSSIHGVEGTYPKLTDQLPSLIKDANYSIC